MSNRIQIYFSKLFSNIILKNRIVATVLYTISGQLAEFKKKMNITLNQDI